MKAYFLLILLTITPSIFAEQTINVVTENWRPYNYEESGKIKGSSTEIVKAVLDQSGYQYAINLYPWARSYKEALNNKNTLIYTIVRIPLREHLFKWVGPVAQSDTVAFFALKDRTDIKIQHLNDAKKYTTGIVREDMKHHYLLSKGFTEGSNIVLASRQKQNVQKLLAGRVDLLVFSRNNMSAEMSSLGVSPDMIVEIFALFKSHPYMAFSQNTSDGIVKKVRQSYIKLKTEGLIKLPSLE